MTDKAEAAGVELVEVELRTDAEPDEIPAAIVEQIESNIENVTELLSEAEEASGWTEPTLAAMQSSLALILSNQAKLSREVEHLNAVEAARGQAEPEPVDPEPEPEPAPEPEPELVLIVDPAQAEPSPEPPAPAPARPRSFRLI